MLFEDCDLYNLENPIPIINLDNLSMDQCIKINDNWEKILSTMHQEAVEKLSDLPTKTLKDKIEFIGEYLELTCE